MIRELTCIKCPRGCSLRAETEGSRVISVTGNFCARGAEYARDECINPMRTLTTTVSCDNGEVIPVKTDREIPKDKLFEAMKILNKAKAHLPIRIGDVIIKDVFGSNIVSTVNRGEK